MTQPAGQNKEVIAFGPFTFVASERLLTKIGVTVQLGGRALDVLIAPVFRAKEPVSKRDLISQPWADVTVDEGSLR
jgi:DNA-binding winged helix-turn-helix (wHTH) protein